MKPIPSPKMHLNFASVFKNTKDFIDAYNQKQPQLTHRLNANHRATAELIVRLYAQQINKAGHEIGSVADLPGFRTYNPSLASCKGCTVRTVINHKKRLLQAGFLVKENHRGADGVELFINPVILGEVQLSTSIDNNQTVVTPLASFFKGRVKNLHPLVHVQQELNNNNSSVDMLTTLKSEKEVVVSSATRTPQEHNRNMRESDASASNGQTKAAEVERTFLLRLVEEFWQQAKRELYPDLWLSAPEEKEVLNHIWRSVYQKFTMKGNRKQWENYQEMLLERIAMVQRWLARNPNHWIPAPHLYFHINNSKNGFDKTWKWYLKQEILKTQVRNQLIIQKTDHQWKQHAKGKGRHKHKTRFELFRMQQKQLAKYNDKKLLVAYEKNLQRNLQQL